MTYTIQYGHTKDVRGVPIIRTPTAPMITRINMLQECAGSMGVAIALPIRYDIDGISRVATELSGIIESEVNQS